MNFKRLAFGLLAAANVLAACDQEGHLLFKRFVETEHSRPTPLEYQQQVTDCFYDTASDQMSAEGYSVLVAYLAEIAARDDKNNLHNLPIARQVKYMAYGQIAMDLYLGCRSQLVPQTALNESCRGKEHCSAVQ